TDQSLDNVKWYWIRKPATDIENRNKSLKGAEAMGGGAGADMPADFSKGPEMFTVLPTDDRFYGDFRARIDDKAMISKLENKNFYEVTLSNKGGLIMPVVIEWTYKDGSKEIERIPAEIWRTNETKVTKVFVKDKEVVSVVLDPKKETADISEEDNVFPRVAKPSKFDELKKKN
ncbi:MAG: M1 family peptidase, partial [Cyclobacteriaceae bacterium]